MKDEITEQQTQAILNALDDAIKNGPWDNSNFLRVIGKNLRDIRNEFANQVNFQSKTEKLQTNYSPNQAVLRSGQQEIFVALYSSEGNNMQAWERILANLPRYIISRPIYSNEEDIKHLIKSKENKINEAYVTIFINKKDILDIPVDKIPIDRFGKPLLSLKDRAINQENIIRFSHLSNVYQFDKGQLIKVS